ncbi:MAG: ABC transporter ATP-binding protein [Chloroflexota bacterium]|nr:ABC transporter ATP-binding protein [Chloroflexota bacterium]
MNEKTIVETQELTKTYGDGAEVRALDGVDMSIQSGEFVAVMGPSGSGKSTLLNMIGALDRPTSGRVLINGQNLAQIRNLDDFRARTVGFIFQMHNLIPTLTARENVEVPMQGQAIGRRARHRRAADLLQMVGLVERMNHLPNMLSGGERQRVAVARALANNPTIILADEPTGELDAERSQEIISLMYRLNHELGTTFVVVTHDLAVARQTNRVLVMNSGRIEKEHIIADAYSEDLRQLKDSPLGRALLGDKEINLVAAGVPLRQGGQFTAMGQMLQEVLKKV